MTHPTPPQTLRTERLTLRLFTESDAEAVWAYASDPEVTRYMDWPTHAALDDTHDYLRTVEADWASGSYFAWAVVENDGQQLVGGVGCEAIGSRVALGYVYARSAWGRGYATEAAQVLVDWLVSQDEIHRVWATCDVANAGSARVLEKLGMQHEGVLRRWSVRPNLLGQPCTDSHVYSLVASSFDNTLPT